MTNPSTPRADTADRKARAEAMEHLLQKILADPDATARLTAQVRLDETFIEATRRKLVKEGLLDLHAEELRPDELAAQSLRHSKHRSAARPGWAWNVRNLFAFFSDPLVLGRAAAAFAVVGLATVVTLTMMPGGDRSTSESQQTVRSGDAWAPYAVTAADPLAERARLRERLAELGVTSREEGFIEAPALRIQLSATPSTAVLKALREHDVLLASPTGELLVYFEPAAATP